jgi:hypothetical protein
VVQVEEVTHHLAGASSPPDFYTIKEEVEFSITIKEKKDGAWIPFAGTDVQVLNIKRARVSANRLNAPEV